jgi:hypothetical protein
MTSATVMTDQKWFDEIHKLVFEFIGDRDELGELMLDGSERHWDFCYEAGLTPQQALDLLIVELGAQ